MAQYAEHGLGDQFTFIRTDALILEKVAQRGVGGVRQRQDGAQCLDGEFQTVFGNQHGKFIFSQSGVQFNRLPGEVTLPKYIGRNI